MAKLLLELLDEGTFERVKNKTKTDSIFVSMSVTFLYESQTGCAESIAKLLHSEALEADLQSSVYSVSDYGDSFELANLGVVVFVVSSTGQGDPPDHALKFTRHLRQMQRSICKDSDAPLPFASVRYALLGLGDSNYDDFQENPKRLARMLKALGAREFYKQGAADDATGLEDVVEPWREQLWDPLFDAVAEFEQLNIEKEQESAAQSSSNKHDDSVAVDASTNGEHDENVTVDASSSTAAKQKIRIRVRKGAAKVGRCRVVLVDCDASDAQWRFDEHTQLARLTASRALTSPDALRETLLVDLAVDERAEFRAGDAFGVRCPNEAPVVDALLARLGVDGDRVVKVAAAAHLGGGDDALASLPSHLAPAMRSACTARQLLERSADVCSPPRKVLLSMLSQHAGDADERATLELLASVAGRERYRDEIELAAPTLLELLERFASCTPPLEHLLDLLPPLQPRYYSVCNSPLDGDARRVSFAFNVLRYAARGDAGGDRRGLCTNWLRAQSVGARVPLFLRASSDFVFAPEAEMLRAPMILVGTGTGVAPLLSLLAHRRALLSLGSVAAADVAPCWLFFGCRERAKDYLFGEQLEAMCESEPRVLERLVVAFSRADPQRKVYVQHRLAEHADDVARMMNEQGGHIFVCGEGSGMMRSVHEAVRIAIGADAERMQALVKSRHYIVDVWHQ
jgi:methionine synthase reductase